MKNLFLKFKHIFTFGGGLATIAAIIKDVLTPLTVFGMWFFLCTLVLGVAVLSIGYFFPNIFAKKESVIKELWYIPLGLSLIVTSGVIASIHEINQKPGNESGQLSKNLKIIKQLQEHTGILKSINSTLVESLTVQKQSLSVQKSIEANTNSSRIQNQELTTTLAFDLNSLHDALLRGDINKLIKFHERGFNLSDVKLSRSIVEAPLILVGLRQNKRNYDEVIKLLLKLQVIQLDEQFEIKPAYSDAYSNIWQNFMSKGAEAEKLSKEGVSFNDFQNIFFENYGYVIPDSFKVIYKSETQSSLSFSFIGAPKGGKVTLLTEAKLHNNTKLVNFLNTQEYPKSKDIIFMNNNMVIQLSMHTGS